MSEKSVNIENIVTNNNTFVNNADERKGEKMMRAFASLVRGASTLDGDLRLNNRHIEKVNYGSIRLFGNRSIRTTEEENVRVRSLFYRSVETYINEVAARQNAGGRGLTVEKLAALRTKCKKLIIGGEANGAQQDEDPDSLAAKPLSRRTVCQVIQMIDDEVNLKSGKFGTEREKLLGRVETLKYDGEPWRLVGGKDGMRMSRKHFLSMFEEALEVASKAKPAYKDAFKKQIAYYKRLFDENRTGGELEMYFTGSLDAKTIAAKMVDHIKKGIAPELPGERKRHSLTGAVGQAMHDKLVKLRLLREQVGEIRLNERVDISAIHQEPAAAVDVVDAAEKKLLNELLLNKSVEELECCGFDGGERLGRVFYRNLHAFDALCANVREREAARKAHRPVPAECKVLSALSLVSPDLAAALEKLVLRLDAKVFKGAAATEVNFFAAAQDIFDIIADARFEDAIDSCLRKALDEHGVVSKLLGVLRSASEGDDLAFVAVRNGIENADTVTLRRMFVSCLTVDSGEAMPKAEDDFSYGGLLKGLGPYSIKLLQGLDEKKIIAEKGPLHASIQKALKEIRSMQEPIDEDTIKADLLSYVHSNDDIAGITVKKLLGAASIGQTMLCTVRMKDGNGDIVEKEVVYKLQRPGVAERLEQEMTNVGEQLERIAAGRAQNYQIGDVNRLRDQHKVNVEQMLPECDFTNEVVNAMMGIKAYDPPQDGKRKMSFFSKVQKSQRADVTTPSLFGSEKLVLKPQYRNDDGIKAALAAIKACKTREDCLKPEVTKYFMPVNPNSMLVELADGKDLSVFSQTLDQDVDNALKLPANKVADALKAAKAKARRAFEALLQLSAGFVDAALVKPGHFFHADLHMGNIMFDENSGKITLIDYGRIGHLSDKTADALRTLMKYGRTGFPGSLVGRQSAGGQLVTLYCQMLQAEKDTNPNVQRTLDWILDVNNYKKLEEAFSSLVQRKDCTVGNILDRFMEAISSVPGLRGLPAPKAVLSFQKAFAQLQKTVKSIQAKIARIDQALATSQSASYTNDDLTSLGTIFGEGGQYELQNIGYPKVDITYFSTYKRTTTHYYWQENKSEDGRLKGKLQVVDKVEVAEVEYNRTNNEKPGGLKGDGQYIDIEYSRVPVKNRLVVTLSDEKMPFEGTGKGVTSSVVLGRLIEEAKNARDSQQRYAALATILRVLTEEEKRLKEYDFDKFVGKMQGLADDLSVKKGQVSNGAGGTTVEFLRGNGTITKDALVKIGEEKAKIMAAMESLRPHCTTETLYNTDKEIQEAVVPYVSVNPDKIRFEQPVASPADIVIANVAGVMLNEVYSKGQNYSVDNYCPQSVVQRFDKVNDVQIPWSEFLLKKEFKNKNDLTLAYVKDVNTLTKNAKDLKDFSFYELPIMLWEYKFGVPWDGNGETRFLTEEELKGYRNFHDFAKRYMKIANLPDIPLQVTLADYRTLLESIGSGFDIPDLDKFEIIEGINTEAYESYVNHPEFYKSDKVPELETFLKTHSDFNPSAEFFKEIKLKGPALKAYEKLVGEIRASVDDENDDEWDVSNPTAYDYALAYERLCEQGKRDLGKLEGEMNRILCLNEHDNELSKRIIDQFPGFAEDLDALEKLGLIVKYEEKKATKNSDADESMSREELEESMSQEDADVKYKDYFNLLLQNDPKTETDPKTAEKNFIDAIKSIKIPEEISTEDEDKPSVSVLEKHGIHPIGIPRYAFEGFDFNKEMPEKLQVDYQKLVGAPKAKDGDLALDKVDDLEEDSESEEKSKVKNNFGGIMDMFGGAVVRDEGPEKSKRATYAEYLEKFIEVKKLKSGDPAILKEALRLVNVTSNSSDDDDERPTLTLPQYMQYMCKARKQNLEIEDKPTYGQVLVALRGKKLEPREVPLNTHSRGGLDHREEFDNLLKNALELLHDKRIEELSEKTKGRPPTVGDYLDLAELVKQNLTVKPETRNLLEKFVNTMNNLPFKIYGGMSYDPNDLKSCAAFINKCLSFNKCMMRSKQIKPDLYKMIAAFNQKQTKVQKPTVELPDENTWNALSFYDLRGYLDRYLKLAYPDQDVVNALSANDFDYGKLPLNDLEKQAYRILEEFAVDNNQIERPALVQGMGQDVVIDNRPPKNHAELTTLYEKVKNFQSSFPLVGDGDGFEVTVGGALDGAAAA